MIVRWLGLLIFAVAVTAAPARAQEGLQIDDAHRQLKAIIQKDRPSKPELDQAVAALNRMIAENEQRFGKTSPQIGLLLLDVGEAAVKREYVSAGKERLETLRRGIRALDAGDLVVRAVESQYPAATISRARARRFAGFAHGKLDDTAASERAYREGLEIHRRRFGDHTDQLMFFEPLDAVSPAGPVRLETARLWLRVAMSAGNRRQAEAANAAIKTATLLVSPVVVRADAARRSAEALANSGKRDEAYAALATAFQAARTPEDRTTFTARVKPSVFFVYQDPLAPKKTGWDHSEKPVPVYDLVATRFLVDKGLQPFIEEGRNNLLGLLVNLKTVYATGNADDARYFCRIVPGGYNGYSGSGLPATCAETPSWAGWLMSMGGVDDPRRLLALGMDLADKELAKGPSAAASAARIAAHIALTELEARYGSPDSFLTELERLDQSGAGQRIPSALIFYAGMLRDDPAEVRLSLQRAGGYDKLSESSSRESDNPLKNKLYLTGPRVAAFLCGDNTLKVTALTRAVQCERAGMPIPDAVMGAIRSGAPSGAGDSSEIAAMPELVDVTKLASPPKSPAAVQPVVQGRQPLPNADPLIIQRSLTSKAAGEQGFMEGVRYDIDYEIIANTFARQGKLALARDWAGRAVSQDASRNGPATIFSAWLAEGHAEGEQRRGWTELASGNPIMADALFSGPVNAEGRPADPNSREEKTSFDWTRTIGAFHGRMMARQALSDVVGAKEDARAFVAYTRRALQRQSFTRFETRDLVVRFARPALLVAVQILVGPSGRLDRQTSPQDFNTIFEALQLVKPSSTGATVTRLAARLSQRSTDLAVAARGREELRLRWDTARLDTIKEANDKNTALVRKLGQELSEMDRRIAAAYPAYVNLTGTTAVDVDRTIETLGKDQALIAYAFANRDAYVVALSAAGGRVVRLDKSLEDIRKTALAVRQSIEPQAGQFVRFRNEDAARLSDLVLKPVWDLVAAPGNRILVTVSDGPVDGLPLSILPVPGEPASFVIDKVATSRLPSISSLVLLRTLGAPPTGQQPFIGIGDPILDGNPSQRRGLSVGDVSADRKSIDVKKLRALPRLPETADEITRLAKLFGSGSDAIVLGAAATEAKVRTLPLASFRTIAFATHGLVAGELSAFNEPGLVLTPPSQPSGDDDGFLSASEISALDLRAELVLLSACNTGSTDGKEGTDGLSGLAKAFFFAGARNLLVSHWSVESSAATHLTTAMIQSRQSGVTATYAEALRSAILSLKAKSVRQAAHPGFWGAFEVIGN